MAGGAEQAAAALEARYERLEQRIDLLERSLKLHATVCGLERRLASLEVWCACGCARDRGVCSPRRHAPSGGEHN